MVNFLYFFHIIFYSVVVMNSIRSMEKHHGKLKSPWKTEITFPKFQTFMSQSSPLLLPGHACSLLRRGEGPGEKVLTRCSCPY